MIANRIASTAALATFGLAALGGIALAAPGNADTGTSGRSSASDNSSTSGKASNGPTSKLESTPGGIPAATLKQQLEQQTAKVNQQLAELQSKGDNLSINDMFKMQMLMNSLSQLSEMSTNVMSAMNSSISSMARNVKA
jgi:hypothetical protein